MADAAGFTFGHVCHTCLAGTLTVVEFFRVAVAALVGLNVEVVTEDRVVNRL